MRNFLESICVTITTFSRLPLPNRIVKSFGYSMALLPVVGILIGLSLWGWQAFTDYFSINKILVDVGYLIIPVALVGGIHLDGFADTVDAISSHTEKEKALEILKDPRVGSFSVITLICYFILIFALIYVYFEHSTNLILFSSIFVISRSFSAFMGFNGTLLSESSFLAALRKDDNCSKLSAVTLLFAIMAVLLSVLSTSLFFAIPVVISAFVSFVIYKNALKRFDGINGDIVGYNIVINELVMLGSIVLLMELL